jgi:hypothetical protein
LHEFPGLIVQGEALASGWGEVDDDVAALAGGELKLVEFDGCGQEALVGADLVEALAVGKRKDPSA